MNEELTRRANELRLLGWSQEGSNYYSKLFDIKNVEKNSYFFEGILVVFLLTLCIGLFFYLSRRDDKDKIRSNTNSQIEAYNDLKVNYQKTSKSISEDKVENNQINTNKSFSIIINNLIKLFHFTAVDIDIVIIHIVLIFVISFDFIKRLNIQDPYQIKDNHKESLHVPQAIELRKNLSDKSEDELRGLLEEPKMLEGLTQAQLIDLVLISPNAIGKINFQMRRSQLMKKTNSELKLLLQGTSNLSRLKKKDLVEKLLCLEYESR